MNWISVNDKLPPFKTPVMLFGRYRDHSAWEIIHGALDHHRNDVDNQWWVSFECCCLYQLEEVTHWYPILTDQPPDTVGKVMMVAKAGSTDYSCKPPKHVK